MIICKRPDPPDDHLQEAGSSRWSFASGRMIICRSLDPLDDHLQVASPSRWSFAKGRILRMIICNNDNDNDNDNNEGGDRDDWGLMGQN